LDETGRTQGKAKAKAKAKEKEKVAEAGLLT
jgi:hypothetical protein